MRDIAGLLLLTGILISPSCALYDPYVDALGVEFERISSDSANIVSAHFRANRSTIYLACSVIPQAIQTEKPQTRTQSSPKRRGQRAIMKETYRTLNPAAL